MRFTFLKRRMAYSSKLLLSLKPSEHLQDDLYMTRASVTLHGFGTMSWDIWGFPGGSDGKKKNLPAMQESLGSIPGWGKSPGEGNGYSLQYTCLENSMDRGVRRAIAHAQTRLNDSQFHFPGVFTDCYMWRSDIDRGIRKRSSLIFLKYSLHRNDTVKSIPFCLLTFQ